MARKSNRRMRPPKEKSPSTPEEAGSSPQEMVLKETFGSGDRNFLDTSLIQLARAYFPGGKIDEKGMELLLSIIKGIRPRDQLETMLAVQMAAVHLATIRFAGGLAQTSLIQEIDIGERTFGRLARTFVAQIEALTRYRSGGEQKVTVQRVTVSDGGNAIVGNATQDQRETPAAKAAASPPLLADARTLPMPSIKPDRQGIGVERRRTLRR